MKKALLYSRFECPLCEYVETWLQDLSIHYELVDIDSDEELMRCYHTSIPVLLYNDIELKWPFELDEMKHFLGQKNNQE